MSSSLAWGFGVTSVAESVVPAIVFSDRIKREKEKEREKKKEKERGRERKRGREREREKERECV